MTYPATSPRLEARTAVPALAGHDVDPAKARAIRAAIDRNDIESALRVALGELFDVLPAAGRA